MKKESKESKKLRIRIYSIDLSKDVPSFKNKKEIWKKYDTGKPFIATNPQYKATMQEIKLLLRSGLIFEGQEEAVTWTARSQPYWTALLTKRSSPTITFLKLIEPYRPSRKLNNQA